ncbi:hypothetical protein ACFV2X_17190 [Streptomyces sp. NPDC059679]
MSVATPAGREACRSRDRTEACRERAATADELVEVYRAVAGAC